MRRAKEKLSLNSLRDLRDRRSVSQTDLAAAMGVSRSAVAMWETGRSSPDNTMLLRLAEYFDVTVDYLLGRDSELPEGSAQDSKLFRGNETKQTIFYRMSKDGIGAETLTAAEVRELENYARFLIARRTMSAPKGGK